MESIRPSLESLILCHMQQDSYRPLKQHELIKSLNLAYINRSMMRQALRNLEARGQVIKLRGNRWMRVAADEILEGRLSVHPKGFGWVDFDAPGEKSLFIPPRRIGAALHGDRVQVRKVSSGDAPSEGRILRLVARERLQLAGLLKRTPYYWYVVPDDPRIPQDIRISGTTPRPGQEDHKVVVKLDPMEADLSSGRQMLKGQVAEDLGHRDDPGVDMLSVMRNHSLYAEFPERIERIARDLPTVPGETDREGRRDLNDRLVFTIDPADAKDIDDAVSLEQLPDNRYRLGVHIADVAHFVEKNSIIDREAARRGNTVYMADRTVTMLPRHLTTEVCSLYPGRIRLTYSVDLIIDAKGRVHEADFFKSFICSSACLNYEQVQQIIDGKDTHRISSPVRRVLIQMHDLAQILRKNRTAAGALDFSQPEVAIDLDPAGNIRGFRRREARDAYQLIEEFMLAANKASAEKLLKHGVPSLFRIHEEPNEEQWQEMGDALKSLGIAGRPCSRSDINDIITLIDNEALRPIATICVLRNLQRALYSVDCEPHFGLAFDHYTHFTSPIRRYADLVTHRILYAIDQQGRKTGYRHKTLKSIAMHCNNKEFDAETAERESIAIKRVEYYNDLLMRGETGPYEGYIVSILSRGFIVELKDTLQHGLIAFSSLHDDHYVVDENRTTARGHRHGRIWKMGQALRVELDRVDVSRRMVDFRLCRENTQKGKALKSGRRKRRKGKHN